MWLVWFNKAKLIRSNCNTFAVPWTAASALAGVSVPDTTTPSMHCLWAPAWLACENARVLQQKTKGVQKSALMNPSMSLGGLFYYLKALDPCVSCWWKSKLDQKCDLGTSNNLTGDKSVCGVLWQCCHVTERHIIVILDWSRKCPLSV